MKIRQRCRLRRLFLGCLIAASGPLAMPAHAGPWDCGSDIVPITEPLAEEGVPTDAAQPPARAAEAEETPERCRQQQLAERACGEEAGPVGEQDGASGGRAAADAGSAARAAGAVQPWLGGWATRDSVPPPLLSRRTSFSFASALARVTAGRPHVPYAPAAAAEPSDVKGRELDAAGAVADAPRGGEPLAGRSTNAAGATVAEACAGSDAAAEAAAVASCEQEAAANDSLALDDRFLRRQLVALDRLDAVGAGGFSGPIEPVADPSTLADLAEALQRGETLRAGGDRPGTKVIVESCLGSCVLVETEPAPQRAAERRDALGEDFLRRQLDTLAQAEPVDVGALVEPIGPIDAGGLVDAGEIAERIEPSTDAFSFGSLAERLADGIADGIAELIASANAELERAGVATNELAVASADTEGGEASGREEAKQPPPQRIGACAVVASLKETYLPYDFAPEDLRAAAPDSLEGGPFYLRHRAEPEAITKRSPAAGEDSPTGQRHQRTEAAGTVSDEPVETAELAHKPAHEPEATVAMYGSPHCWLDEWVWQSERALAEGAPLRRALTPAAVGRQIAAIVSRGGRAASATAGAVAGAWPQRTGGSLAEETDSQTPEAGERLLARAEATEETADDEDAGREEDGGRETVQVADVDRPSVESTAPGAATAIATATASASPSQSAAGPAAEAAGRDAHASRDAQWTAATQQLHAWMDQAKRWSRQLWEVARRPAAGKRLR